jgi:hypothetical protein
MSTIVIGADAVLVVSAGMKQYESFPGIATYNANGNLYGNGAFLGGHYQAAGTAIGPHLRWSERAGLSVEASFCVLGKHSRGRPGAAGEAISGRTSGPAFRRTI